MLPQKSLLVLSSVRDKLLKEKALAESVINTLPEPKKREKTTQRMRHAKAPNAYQRWRQKGDCW